MNKTLHAAFVCADDCVRAVEALMHLGVRSGDINVILPHVECKEIKTVGQDEVKLERPTIHRLASNIGCCHETLIDAEEGAGIGLVLGLITALCVPGIGLIAGTGAIVASLMTAGTAIGGIAGGIYGHLIDQGIDREVAQKIADLIAEGSATISVSVPQNVQEYDIRYMLENYGGQIIQNER